MLAILFQQSEVDLPVCHGIEDVAPSVPSLRNRMSAFRNRDSGEARHASRYRSLLRQALRKSEKVPSVLGLARGVRELRSLTPISSHRSPPTGSVFDTDLPRRFSPDDTDFRSLGRTAYTQCALVITERILVAAERSPFEEIKAPRIP